jgi:phage shock protein A
MSSDRPGLFSRFRNLVSALFGGYLRDGERSHPEQVYQQAIDQRTKQYRELKEAVAGILYMRNKLEAEIRQRGAELDRLTREIRDTVRAGRDSDSLALIAYKQTLVGELARCERELEAVRGEAEDAKVNLTRFREDLRDLAREKGRALITLANAKARRRMSEALEGLSVDAEMKALESVREYIARLSTEGALDRELGDATLRRRLRDIRSEARDEAARSELEELKRALRPALVGEGSANRVEASASGPRVPAEALVA